MGNLNEVLNENIPQSVISTRSQGGKTLSYLESWYVIDRLNAVFGNTGWDWEIKSLTSIPGEKASYICHGKLTVLHGSSTDGEVSSKEGIGYGSDKYNFNAGEMASKEAESDALKRAAMKFGRSLGLALYDKTGSFIDETPLPKEVNEAKVEVVQKPKDKPKTSKSIDVLRDTIKGYFGVLQGTGKVTRDEFIEKYLNGKTTDALTNDELLIAKTKIKEAFIQLN